MFLVCIFVTSKATNKNLKLGCIIISITRNFLKLQVMLLINITPNFSGNLTGKELVKAQLQAMMFIMDRVPFIYCNSEFRPLEDGWSIKHVDFDIQFATNDIIEFL